MAGSREDALEYHSRGTPGKVAIQITKPCATQSDLSLAYTPGVAEPVRRIAGHPLDAFRYTARGNLVGVITNGTAVLGLGDVGALAGKPVMEGKALLFKRFADVDVFDIEVDTHDPDELIRIIKTLEPTFGGINLEDVKAPECFEVEARLKEILDIPVFHDDQHGTAIIAGAALLNALELADKDIGDVRMAVSGAGAAGIASSTFFIRLGMRPENIVMSDINGVLYRGRPAGVDRYQEPFATDSAARTLADAVEGADVLLGVSAGGLVTKEMVASMGDRPVVFALANPDPEISYDDARAARPDAFVATGRSDYPNQVNNVLGFPFIFRGALDVRARAINEEMKIAACRALIALAREEVPDSILRAYGLESLSFGPDYLLPKPLDPRVPLWVAPAVAEAAMATGVARHPIRAGVYRDELARRLVRGHEVMSVVHHKAKASPMKVVFSEGEEPKIVRAAATLIREGIAVPILIGDPKTVWGVLQELHVDEPIEIVDPAAFPGYEQYVRAFYEQRSRKGVTLREARTLLRQPNYLGAMMVASGDADAFIAGLTQHYPDVIRPALQVIGPVAGRSRVAGAYLMVLGNRPYVLADTTVNIDPTAEELADIALMAADRATEFDLVPRVAMLSFSSFGSTRHPRSNKVAEAVELVKTRRPELMIDGEMMADAAVSQALRDEDYPFSSLVGEANVLVFPSLEAANTCYKLLQHLGGATAIGPILMGMRLPVHVLVRGAEVTDIVNVAAIAAVDAQEAARTRELPIP